MIELDIRPYCHDCPAFHPVIIQVNDMNIDMSSINRAVRCENARKCCSIERYLEKAVKNNVTDV